MLVILCLELAPRLGESRGSAAGNATAVSLLYALHGGVLAVCRVRPVAGGPPCGAIARSSARADLKGAIRRSLTPRTLADQSSLRKRVVSTGRASASPRSRERGVLLGYVTATRGLARRRPAGSASYASLLVFRSPSSTTTNDTHHDWSIYRRSAGGSQPDSRPSR